MIAIIDYGMGNIHSVQKAIASMPAKIIITDNPKYIESCTKLVLPGVGAFADAVLELEKKGLTSAIIDHIKQKKPFLGICLGMQLLFESSQESNAVKGLGILKGTVKRFKDINGLKVPHMGWNQLKKVTSHQTPVTSECPLWKDIPDDAYVYFCHSYYPEPQDQQVIAATCDYGIDFTCVIWQTHIFGVQFHPEKSQEVGLKILKNFVDLC